MSASGALLSLASLASAAHYQLGFAVPPTAASILRAIAHFQLLRLLKKSRFIGAGWLAAWIVRFPLGSGDSLPLVSHIARALLWGRQSVGLRLPPAVPWALFFATVKQNGVWKRHHTERAFREACGPIYRIYQPLSNADDHSLGTMIVWVSEPGAVEQVLADREPISSPLSLTPYVNERTTCLEYTRSASLVFTSHSFFSSNITTHNQCVRWSPCRRGLPLSRPHGLLRLHEKRAAGAAHGPHALEASARGERIPLHVLSYQGKCSEASLMPRRCAAAAAPPPPRRRAAAPPPPRHRCRDATSLLVLRRHSRC